MAFYYKNNKERTATLNFISAELEKLSKTLERYSSVPDNQRNSILITAGDDLEEYSDILKNISRSKPTEDKIRIDQTQIK